MGIGARRLTARDSNTAAVTCPATLSSAPVARMPTSPSSAIQFTRRNRQDGEQADERERRGVVPWLTSRCPGRTVRRPECPWPRAPGPGQRTGVIQGASCTAAGTRLACACLVASPRRRHFRAASAGPADPCSPARVFGHADERRRQVELARGRHFGARTPARSGACHASSLRATAWPGHRLVARLCRRVVKGRLPSGGHFIALYSRPHVGTSPGERLPGGIRYF
jgi:hypothetical protein